MCLLATSACEPCIRPDIRLLHELDIPSSCMRTGQAIAPLHMLDLVVLSDSRVSILPCNTARPATCFSLLHQFGFRCISDVCAAGDTPWTRAPASAGSRPFRKHSKLPEMMGDFSPLRFSQAIALLDTLDKDVNTFVMRVREWYSWHFPELVRIVPDNYQYARCALAIQVQNCLCFSGVSRGHVDTT